MFPLHLCADLPLCWQAGKPFLASLPLDKRSPGQSPTYSWHWTKIGQAPCTLSSCRPAATNCFSIPKPAANPKLVPGLDHCTWGQQDLWNISPCSCVTMDSRIFKLTRTQCRKAELPVGAQKPQEVCATASQLDSRVSCTETSLNPWGVLNSAYLPACLILKVPLHFSDIGICQSHTKVTHSGHKEGKGEICSLCPWPAEPWGPTQHSWIMQDHCPTYAGYVNCAESTICPVFTRTKDKAHIYHNIWTLAANKGHSKPVCPVR